MEVHNEMRAAIIMVSGDWARYLETIEPEDRKDALEGLFKGYKDIFNKLQEMYGFSFRIQT